MSRVAWLTQDPLLSKPLPKNEAVRVGPLVSILPVLGISLSLSALAGSRAGPFSTFPGEKLRPGEEKRQVLFLVSTGSVWNAG